MLIMSSRRYIEPMSPISKFLVTCKSSALKPVPPIVYVTGRQADPFGYVAGPARQEPSTVCGVTDEYVSLPATRMPHGAEYEPVATTRCFGAAFDTMNGYSLIDDWSNE